MDMFDVDFDPLKDTTKITQKGDEFSLAGFNVIMKRRFKSYYLNVYLPTGLLAITSLIGFLIPPDIVPGRMALLVTIFLVIVNISSTERNRGPRVGNTYNQHEIDQIFLTCLIIFRHRLLHTWIYGCSYA